VASRGRYAHVSPGTHSGIRQPWLATVLNMLQGAVGTMLKSDRLSARDFLGMFVQSLPSAHGPLERLVLRSLLIEFAGRCGTTLHARVHPGRDAKHCRLIPAAFLESFWTSPAARPQDGFNAWSNAFFENLAAVHPVSPAERAAILLRQTPARGWDVVALARELHTSPAHLLRQFQREYGMSIRRYIRHVLVALALERVEDEKVDALAVELGYRSPKNFYHAFKEVTGVTPARFRLLSPEAASRIVETVHFTLGTSHRGQSRPTH
jgi:AraC-like DNA-binding protein